MKQIRGRNSEGGFEKGAGCTDQWDADQYHFEHRMSCFSNRVNRTKTGTETETHSKEE
jgi:hypothetical protein